LFKIHDQTQRELQKLLELKVINYWSSVWRWRRTTRHIWNSSGGVRVIRKWVCCRRRGNPEQWCLSWFSLQPLSLLSLSGTLLWVTSQTMQIQKLFLVFVSSHMHGDIDDALENFW